MARTINEIQQQMLDKKSTTSELSALEVLTTVEKNSIEDLTSTSKVAVWRLFIYIISYAIFTFENILDVFKDLIEKLIKENTPHNEFWYKSKAYKFQYGDNLIDNDEYAVIDESKQIIKQVAIVEGDRKIIIKVATLDGDQLVKIDDINKINAFSEFMNKIKDAGTVLEIINEDADKLRVQLEFYYDALVIDADGKEINTGVAVVELAIKQYLNSIEFNGEFDVNKMNDYIQQAVGYKSLKVNYVGFKAGIAVSYMPINRAYTPLSGYMNLEELEVIYYAI